MATNIWHLTDVTANRPIGNINLGEHTLCEVTVTNGGWSWAGSSMFKVMIPGPAEVWCIDCLLVATSPPSS
jgi:hypothetical protein